MKSELEGNNIQDWAGRYYWLSSSIYLMENLLAIGQSVLSLGSSCSETDWGWNTLVRGMLHMIYAEVKPVGIDRSRWLGRCMCCDASTEIRASALILLKHFSPHLPCWQWTRWKNSSANSPNTAAASRAARLLDRLGRIVGLRRAVPPFQVVLAPPATFAGNVKLWHLSKWFRPHLLEWLWALESWLGIGEWPETEFVLLATSLDSTLLCSGAPIWTTCRVTFNHNNFLVIIHCRKEGFIGKHAPWGSLHPRAREIALGWSPKTISRADGCKLPRGAYFLIHPDSRQCTDILFSTAGEYSKLHTK